MAIFLMQSSCRWELFYQSTVYPSVLYQTAIWPVDWTQGHVIGWCEKNGGRWVSVFGERSGVTGLWQHMTRPGSHTPCILWIRRSAASSQQSALICPLRKELNEQMLDLMQNRHNGSLLLFPLLIWLLLVWGGWLFSHTHSLAIK